MEIQDTRETQENNKEESQQKKERNFLKRTNPFVSGFFGGIVGFFLCLAFLGRFGDFPMVRDFFFGMFSEKEVNTYLEQGKQSENIFIREGEDTTIQVVEKATPSVVSIIVKKDVSIYRNNPFDFFFDPFSDQNVSPDVQKQQVGGGTGFFVTADGMIVTNKHVVSDMRAEYSVITQDGSEYVATILARDPSRDIAIVKVEGKDFPVLELGNSQSLQVGQTVIAIGNSLGEFSNSVSRGIISGLGRNIIAGSEFGGSEHLDDIIQTDAAINPGNSGGPLLDISGRVIGMNVAVAQGAENIGFALPVDSIKDTIDQVKETGQITVPFLGVRYVVLNKEIQARNNLKYEYGALVLRGETRSDLAVIPGSPADKAGIVENDIILEIDSKKITQDNDISRVVSRHRVGDELELKIWHKGEEREVRVRLEKRSE